MALVSPSVSNLTVLSKVLISFNISDTSKAKEINKSGSTKLKKLRKDQYNCQNRNSAQTTPQTNIQNSPHMLGFK